MTSVVLRLGSAFILTHTQLHSSTLHPQGLPQAFSLNPVSLALLEQKPAPTLVCAGSGNKSVKALLVCILERNASFSSYFKGFLFSWSS